MINKNGDIIEIIKNKIIEKGLYKKSNRTIYTLYQIIDYILTILDMGISWTKLDRLNNYGLGFKGKSIYHHFNKYVLNGIFDDIYLKNNKSMKLKYLTTDTATIKNEEFQDANFGYKIKNKRTVKISVVCDSNSIPLTMGINNGNISDTKMFEDNIEEIKDMIKYTNRNNKTKRYLMADSFYDTKNIMNKIRSLGLKPLIRQNKKNIKNPLLLRHMSDKDKITYRKRIKVEHSFNWLFHSNRLRMMNEKKFKTYLSFAYICIVQKIRAILKSNKYNYY